MNILQMVEQKGISLKQVSSNKGGEYHSACPACGGENRFHVWPAQGEDGSFWCRGCDKGGDAVAYLRIYEGMACSAAHATLGRECTSDTCSKIGRCRQGREVGGKRHEGTTAVPLQRRGADWTPGEAQPSSDLWREHAEKLVVSAHQALLECPERLAYLAARGIPAEAVVKYRLGWLEKDNYRSRESWGLPTELRPDGKPKKLFLPAGIVIPLHVGGSILYRVRIRRDVVSGDEARYYWVPGSGNDVVVINPSARAFMVVESDLDGLMVDHAAGDLVGTVPMGTCSAKPKETAAQILRSSAAILVALDFEPRQNQKTGIMENPGGQAAKWWTLNFSQARRWPVPSAKDPGEAYQTGVDIRAWVRAGLPPAMTVASKAQDVVFGSPLGATTSCVFDRDAALQQISDTCSLVSSSSPKGALEWIYANRPDVVAYLETARAKIDQSFEHEDETELTGALDIYRKYHARAFDIFEAQPPLIEREG